MVRHGGCLGLGLAAMGTHKAHIYEQLKMNLYQDDAVTGEAAAIAMGMVMLASKSSVAIQDMVAVSGLMFLNSINNCRPMYHSIILNQGFSRSRDGWRNA